MFSQHGLSLVGNESLHASNLFIRGERLDPAALVTIEDDGGVHLTGDVTVDGVFYDVDGEDVFGKISASFTSAGEDIVSNAAAIETNADAVADAVADIATNADAMVDAVADIATNANAVAGAVADIATNADAVAGAVADIATNADAIADNAAALAALPDEAHGRALESIGDSIGQLSLGYQENDDATFDALSCGALSCGALSCTSVQVSQATLVATATEMALKHAGSIKVRADATSVALFGSEFSAALDNDSATVPYLLVRPNAKQCIVRHCNLYLGAYNPNVFIYQFERAAQERHGLIWYEVGSAAPKVAVVRDGAALLFRVWNADGTDEQLQLSEQGLKLNTKLMATQAYVVSTLTAALTAAAANHGTTFASIVAVSNNTASCARLTQRAWYSQLHGGFSCRACHTMANSGARWYVHLNVEQSQVDWLTAGGTRDNDSQHYGEVMLRVTTSFAARTVEMWSYEQDDTSGGARVTLTIPQTVLTPREAAFHYVVAATNTQFDLFWDVGQGLVRAAVYPYSGLTTTPAGAGVVAELAQVYTRIPADGIGVLITYEEGVNERAAFKQATVNGLSAIRDLQESRVTTAAAVTADIAAAVSPLTERLDGVTWGLVKTATVGLEGFIEQIKGLLLQMISTAATMRSDHDSLRGELDALTTAAVTATAVSIDIAAAVSPLTERLDGITWGSTVVSLEAFVTRVNGIVTQIIDATSTLQTRHVTLRNEHDALRAKHDTLRVEHDALRAEHAVTVTAVDTMGELVAGYNARIAMLERSINSGDGTSDVDDNIVERVTTLEEKQVSTDGNITLMWSGAMNHTHAVVLSDGEATETASATTASCVVS